MKLEDLSWMGKREFTQKARKSRACDISIRKSISDGKTKVRFIIRNGFYELISDTEFLQFSIADRKHLYFMTGTPETGLKMTFQDSLVSDNRYVQINKTGDAGKLLPFCGDYEFRFDDECKLYYIQK